jgi:hypothetical protein
MVVKYAESSDLDEETVSAVIALVESLPPVKEPVQYREKLAYCSLADVADFTEGQK